nr:MAG TPA: hypothetical protein [Caudoviricetes sp.]
MAVIPPLYFYTLSQTYIRYRIINCNLSSQNPCLRSSYTLKIVSIRSLEHL